MPQTRECIAENAGTMIGVASRRAVLLTIFLAGAHAHRAAGQESDREFTNLQVLPEDISESELSGWMLGNLRGLGLPRFEGRGCLHCHVGDLERPRDEWDYASDDKEAKLLARRMMEMVRHINGEHLAGVEVRGEPPMRVTCHTCHAGRVNPRPLPDVLIAAYDAAGVDSLLAEYEALRSRYLGSNAYDFRLGTLAGIASTIARRGAFDDALRVSVRNEEAHPGEGAARRTTFGIRVWRAVAEQGAEAAIAEFRRLRDDEPGTMTPGVLDGLGWGLLRAGQPATAIALFRENREAFADAYVPFESLTDARLDAGEISVEEAIAMYEEWLDRHPNTPRARNRIVNLRSRG